MTATPKNAETAIDRAKIWSIGLLHMGQSFPGALAAVALPAIFRQNGLGLEMYWLFALPLIPGWLRWLFAIVIDNHGSTRWGFRKTWIVPCTLLGATLYLAIGQVEPAPDQIIWIIVLLCINSVVMTAQDVAVDGLAAESFSSTERSLGAAVIVYLMFMGTVAAQTMVAGVDHYGWPNMMACAAAILVLVALPTFWREEQSAPAAATRRRDAGESASVLALLRRPDSRLVLPMLGAIGFSSNLMRAILPVFLVDLGLSLGTIGMVFASAVIVGTSIAAFITPRLKKRIGLHRLLCAITLGYVPCALLFYQFNHGHTAAPFIAIGLAYVMCISTMMWMLVTEARLRWSSAEQAATDFSTQASVANFGEWLGASAAGFFAAALGWSGYFLLAWFLAALAAITFLLVSMKVDAAQGALKQ